MKVPVSLSVLELNLQKQKKHQPYILDSENEEEFGYSFLQRSLSSARVFPQAGMRQSRLDLYIKMTYPKTSQTVSLFPTQVFLESFQPLKKVPVRLSVSQMILFEQEDLLGTKVEEGFYPPSSSKELLPSSSSPRQNPHDN
jgi:hypothetical protein